MLRLAEWPGWYHLKVSDEAAPLVTIFDSGEQRLLPGVQRVSQESVLVHRSHLPLLKHPDAMRALAWPGAPDWATRDERFRALGIKLRTTQHQAIDYIKAREGALIGDDMRLGKTLTAIGAHDPRDGKLVIIAPLSTRGVWLGWLRRVFPDTSIGICAGRNTPDKSVFDNPIVFGHYDIIHKWQVIKDIGTLVLDEAHALTNPKSKRSIAAILFAAHAKRVIALTGTPIWNMPPNLWAVISMVAPRAWGNFYDFANRYGAPQSTGYGTVYEGLSNEEELRLRLHEVMLRRKWVDCVQDLPPITRSVVVADVDTPTRNKLDIIAAKLKSERTNTAGNLASYRRVVSLIKLPTIRREAMRIMNAGEPVVIWTWHREVAERIALDIQNALAVSSKIRPPLVIHGEVNADERERRITEWRSQPCSALVATLAVAGAGIDLSHARIAIMGELDYIPAVIGQGEMRTYDPTRPMDILFVVANHIVEQRIVRALVHKLGAADPLGVGAAVDAIEALRDAVLGPEREGDLDRLLEDFIASMS